MICTILTKKLPAYMAGALFSGISFVYDVLFVDILFFFFPFLLGYFLRTLILMLYSFFSFLICTEPLYIF